MPKEFLVKDESGRGFTVQLPADEVIDQFGESFPLPCDDEDDDCEESLIDWLENAEIGDEIESPVDPLRIIRVK